MAVGQTQKHPEWRVIVDLFRAVDWGALITHATIVEATGLQPETTVYYRHVRQARKALLRDHDIVIDTEPKIGYRRAEPGDYGRSARGDVHRGNVRYRTARKKIVAAPAHLLTPAQQKELEHAMVLVKAIEQSAAKAYRSMKAVLAPVTPHRALVAAGEDETIQQQPH